jgi:hypothetical protein
MQGTVLETYTLSCPCADHKGVCGYGSITPFILNLRNGWRLVVSPTARQRYLWTGGWVGPRAGLDV